MTDLSLIAAAPLVDAAVAPAQPRLDGSRVAVYHRRVLLPMIGTSAGNYEITSQLGLGGMGAVYLARHTLLGRPAAVKVLRPELSHDHDLVQRFFNEARAATAIRHPSIVEIYDFGFLPDHNAYIIMEFLEGESLGARLREVDRVPWTQALILTRQIAGALAAAHEQQIVHRDLKPDNVFIVADPEIAGGERIKLLDFGIAKLSAPPGGNRGTLTGELMGTPTYMAPEQCRGTGAIDGRADLYALGCILYDMLCGRPPFLADGAGDFIAHHLYFPPEPPRAHEPLLPEQVERLVLWLLEKDPDRRPRSAADVIDEIDRIGSATRDRAPLRTEVSGPAPALSGGGLDARAAAPPATIDVVRPPQLAQATPHAAGSPPSADAAARPRWGIALGAAAMIATAGAFWVLGSKSASPRRPESPRAAPAAEISPPVASARVPVTPADVPAAPAPVVEVRFEIDSEPSDAAVWIDGEEVGRTPFAQTVRAAAGTRRYKLRKEGFAEETLELSAEAGASERVPMRKLPAARRPSRPSTADRDRGVNPFEQDP
ncbi:MAG: protein kinase [Kofleriaceae bacterium]